MALDAPEGRESPAAQSEALETGAVNEEIAINYISREQREAMNY